MTGPLLQVEGLTAGYGAAPVLHEVDLSVGAGRIVAVLGANGAGKTTLLRTISGLLPVAAGRVLFDGIDLRRVKVERMVRHGIAHVPEGRGVVTELTVEENLRLGLSGRRSREGAEEAVEEVYDLFPVVREFGRRQAGALSGGQQQQLAIARALVAGPDLLLLDEPSLGLAPRIVDVVFDALAQIRRRGITVLLVEQRAQRTVAFADRTYLMANGEVRLTLDPSDAGDTEAMVHAYLS